MRTTYRHRSAVGARLAVGASLIYCDLSIDLGYDVEVEVEAVNGKRPLAKGL